MYKLINSQDDSDSIKRILSHALTESSKTIDY